MSSVSVLNCASNRRLQMVGDKRKGKAIAVEPRKKSKAEKEADRARVAAAVAERRSRRPDPPFRIWDPAPAQQEQATETAEAEAGAPVPEFEQAGPRRSGRARTQAVPVGAPAAAAQAEETPVRQGSRTRGVGRLTSPLRVGRGRSARRPRRLPRRGQQLGPCIRWTTQSG